MCRGLLESGLFLVLALVSVQPASAAARVDAKHPDALHGQWLMQLPPEFAAEKIIWNLKADGSFSMTSSARKTSGKWQADGTMLKVITTSIDGTTLQEERVEVTPFELENKDRKLRLKGQVPNVIFLKQ